MVPVGEAQLSMRVILVQSACLQVILLDMELIFASCPNRMDWFRVSMLPRWQHAGPMVLKTLEPRVQLLSWMASEGYYLLQMTVGLACCCWGNVDGATGRRRILRPSTLGLLTRQLSSPLWTVRGQQTTAPIGECPALR